MMQEGAFSANFVSAALRGAVVGVWKLEAGTGCIIWDKTAEQVLGLAPPSTLDALLQRILPQDRAVVEDFFQSLSHHDGYQALDFRINCPEGGVRWLRCLGSILPDPGGSGTVPGGFIRDVTDRKKAELRLLESRRQLNTLINNLQGIAYRADAALPWRIQFVSKGVEQLTGYSTAEFEQGGRRWASLVHPDDLEAITRETEAAIVQGRAFSLSYRLFHRSGEIRWVRDRGEAIYDEQGHPLFLEGLIYDITDMVRSEAVLRQSKELFQAVVEGTPDGVFLKDYQEGGRYILINRALERLTGRSADAFLGHTDEEIFPPEVAAQYRDQDRILEQERLPSLTAEQAFEAASGPRLLEMRKFALRTDEGELQYILGIVRDLTEQRALEQKVQKMHRMDAVGQLTGGIAHDFNNLLAIILGYAELLRDNISDPYLVGLTDKVIDASERGGDLVRRLMVFARKHRLEPSIINLNERLPGVVALLSRTLGENVQIELVLSPDLWLTKVDASQVDDAIVNLALNARDAMRGGGLITLRTANVSLDQQAAERLIDAEPGDYVMLAVTDTGHGMEPEVLARVFEPFFTTKEQGRGTGLGLPMVYGFIKQSGGHVVIDSAPGHGTTVGLYLPKAGEKPEAAGGEEKGHEAAGGSETILLVEDNDGVRAMAGLHLQKLGYNVLEAVNAAEALTLIERGLPIDLMFTDIVMPGGISGYDLAQQARRLRPDLPILFTTGYDSPVADRSAERLPNSDLLPKPYRRRELALAIRNVLDAARASRHL
ncbi:MAG TPA: PAS domain-containing protein [Pedomonas sp.]|uniref:PAS domain-containing protein n=1 Tax=Pedomonas sp. TaxID=2976421 RepID=UPI002F42AE54